MNLDFSEEHQLFKSTLERLVKDEIDPLLAKHPADAPLPREACEGARPAIIASQ